MGAWVFLQGIRMYAASSPALAAVRDDERARYLKAAATWTREGRGPSVGWTMDATLEEVDMMMEHTWEEDIRRKIAWMSPEKKDT